jgi:hypothetical protein
MNTNTAFLLALLASWGFLSYSAWRLAARRGLFGPMVDLCALLCPVILFFIVAMRELDLRNPRFVGRATDEVVSSTREEPTRSRASRMIQAGRRQEAPGH